MRRTGLCDLDFVEGTAFQYKCRRCGGVLTHHTYVKPEKFFHPCTDYDSSVFVRFTPEEIAERLWVCRKNVCGEYVQNRGTGGKEQELCYCTTTCQGKPTPIEKLCSHAPGCPGGGHW